MKKPIIYSESPIFAQGDYDVVVGALDEDKLPLYVVVNRTTGVVEFTHEVTAFYKDWLNHFVPSEILQQKEQLPLSLGMKN
jgi:hypothetical protein